MSYSTLHMPDIYASIRVTRICPLPPSYVLPPPPYLNSGPLSIRLAASGQYSGQ